MQRCFGVASRVCFRVASRAAVTTAAWDAPHVLRLEATCAGGAVYYDVTLRRSLEVEALSLLEVQPLYNGTHVILLRKAQPSSWPSLVFGENAAPNPHYRGNLMFGENAAALVGGGAGNPLGMTNPLGLGAAPPQPQQANRKQRELYAYRNRTWTFTPWLWGRSLARSLACTRPLLSSPSPALGPPKPRLRPLVSALSPLLSSLFLTSLGLEPPAVNRYIGNLPVGMVSAQQLKELFRAPLLTMPNMDE